MFHVAPGGRDAVNASDSRQHRVCCCPYRRGLHAGDCSCATDRCADRGGGDRYRSRRDAELLDRRGAFGAEAKGLLRELHDLSAIRDAIGADRALVINSATSDTAIRLKQEYSYAGLRRIIELSPGLADFADFQQWAAEFWTQRNETMDANIVRIAALFPGQRVAVICGYEHRYYLRSLLRNDETAGRLKLREYWNY